MIMKKFLSSTAAVALLLLLTNPVVEGSSDIIVQEIDDETGEVIPPHQSQPASSPPVPPRGDASEVRYRRRPLRFSDAHSEVPPVDAPSSAEAGPNTGYHLFEKEPSRAPTPRHHHPYFHHPANQDLAHHHRHGHHHGHGYYRRPSSSSSSGASSYDLRPYYEGGWEDRLLSPFHGHHHGLHHGHGLGSALRAIEDLRHRMDAWTSGAMAPWKQSRVGPGGSYSPGGVVAWNPTVDITERDDAVVWHAELPGVKKEDVSVAVRGNRLEISGSRSARGESRDKDGRIIRIESSSGSFKRVFTIPEGADPSGLKASFGDDGILEVVCPKRVPSQSFKVPIADRA